MSRAIDDEKEYVEKFTEYLKYQSISTDPAYEDQVISCAQWVRDLFGGTPFQVEILETAKHPVVLASYIKGKDYPTYMFYGHYDVQPVDPLDEWGSPPFEPAIRDGSIIARGAQDNKGQSYYTIRAICDFVREHDPDFNIKVLIEGEEEIGSPSMEEFLTLYEDKVKTDYIFLVDSETYSLEKPTVPISVRGLITFEIIARVARSDMHSGLCGGAVRNPMRLCLDLFKDVWDADGHITIPGFYEGIRTFTDEERSQILSDVPDEEYYEATGIECPIRESGYTPLESTGQRPTVEINGFEGGYTGPGFKTVIPAQCMMKVSCRLIAGQDPEHVRRVVSQYLLERVPDGAHVEIRHMDAGRGVAADINDPMLGKIKSAYETVLKKETKLSCSGGSIPLVDQLANGTGGKPFFLGLGLSEDLIHAPNENISTERLRLGYEIITNLLTQLN
ncbi:MAG: Succinyl-diaminopimelate desuccinylase [Chlamydiia bacterium]|nr:Succinyl-diaminopimelate desuccinylase [Chlamydiia bacterium]